MLCLIVINLFNPEAPTSVSGLNLPTTGVISFVDLAFLHLGAEFIDFSESEASVLDSSDLFSLDPVLVNLLLLFKRQLGFDLSIGS